MLFWTTADLENKLLDFRTYFNNHRTHTSLEGRTPDTPVSRPIANLRSFRCQPHCLNLYLPKTLDRCISGQPWENFQLNHLVIAFLVAARFADPIVSLPPYQFARDGCPPWKTGLPRTKSYSQRWPTYQPQRDRRLGN